MFKTELHLHTSETSKCGRMTAAQQVQAYHDAGYSTIVVSDHLSPGFYNRHPDYTDSEAGILFFDGYRNAKRAAKAYEDMHVIPAGEIEFDGCNGHFVVLGIDEFFFARHPGLPYTDPGAFHRYCKEHGYFIINAHPFRGGKNRCHPEYADAIEVYNGNPRHYSVEEKIRALEVAEAHPELVCVSASDAHRTEDTGHGGILTETLIENAEQLIACLKSRQFSLIEDYHPELEQEQK